MNRKVESAQEYPRPPAVESVDRHLRVVADGHIVAETHHPLRVLETGHPPVYYFPPGDVHFELLEPSERETFCEFKGFAHYYSLALGHLPAADVAWYYPEPRPGYEAIANHVAFYAQAFDEATVDGEQVVAQPGQYYGGWITSDVVGPFKKGPTIGGW